MTSAQERTMTVYSCGKNGYGEPWIQNDLGYGWRPALLPPLPPCMPCLLARLSVCLTSPAYPSPALTY